MGVEHRKYSNAILISRWNSDCYRRHIHSPLNLFLGYPCNIAQNHAIKFQYANPYTLLDDPSSKNLGQGILKAINKFLY